MRRSVCSSATVLVSLLCALAMYASGQQRKLLVISVDGLDYRYLKQADSFGLRIPNIRRMMHDGFYADGVVGVYPSITWPSHTSLVTGVRPDQHDILGNRRPKSEGGDYYWTPDLLHSRTLWQAAKAQGLTTASVTWPVTTGAEITWDLPEYFQRRNGGSMDTDSIASKGTPGLAEAIGKAYPSFDTQWMDDRSRTLAACYLLQEKKPNLFLVHLVDLDSEEHDIGPFTPHAFAVLEWTDQNIGSMLAAASKDYDVALVSDHGFERIEGDVQLRYLMQQNGQNGDLRTMGGVAVTRDPAVAAFLRTSAKDPANKLGREIPHEELMRYAPQLGDSIAAFEPADHYMFAYAPAPGGPYITPPPEKGDHGLWPTHPGYRSVLVLYGPHVKQGYGPEIDLTSIAARLAQVGGIHFP